MSNFKEEVDRLTPLLQIAEAAHHAHQKHCKAGLDSADWKAYKETKVYDQLLTAFWDAQRRLEAAEQLILESLSAGSRQGVTSALAYLAIQRRPFRSGYMTQKLSRALKKVPLVDADRHILRGILLDRMTWPWSQPRDLWGLIPAVRTPELAEQIRSLTDDDRKYVERRAFEVICRFGLGSGGDVR